MSGDWVHVMLQSARGGGQDNKQHRIGYCTVYDPDSGMGKFLIPELRDDQDNPFETGFCQVGSMIVGDSFGMQYCLKGGATQDEPNKGEQAEIIVYQRTTGLMAVANLTFNESMPPPGAAPEQETENNTTEDDSNSNITDDDSDAGDDVDGSAQLKATEFITKFAPPDSGEGSGGGGSGGSSDGGGGASFIKFYEDGSGRLNIELTMNARFKQNLNIIVKEGSCNLDVQQGDCNAWIEKGDLNTTVGEGDVNTTVSKGDVTTTVSEGNVTTTVSQGSATLNVTELDILMTAGRDITMNATRDINMTAGRNINRTAS